MTYKLMRCNMKTGTLVIEIMFDLWNHEYETGYEIKVTLWNMIAWRKHIEEYTKNLLGHTYDISRWDKIIRNMKQMKLSEWVIYE